MKKIIFTIILVLFLFTSKGVLAESFSEVEKEDMFYINYDNIYIPFNKILKNEKNMEVFSINLYNDKNFYENKREVENESEEYINLITFYSTPDLKSYVEAQKLIYEFLYPAKKFNILDSNKNIINESFDTIKKKIEKHNIIPSFNNSLIEANLNDSIIVFDELNVLKDYKNYNKVSIPIQFLDNRLNINCNKPGIFLFEFIKEEKKLKEPSYIYDKNFISKGRYKPLYASFKVNILYTDFTIELVNKDKLSVYEVYDNSNNELLGIVELKNGKTKTIPIKRVEEIKVVEVSYDKLYIKNPNNYVIRVNYGEKYKLTYESTFSPLDIEVYTYFYNSFEKLKTKYASFNIEVYDKLNNKVTTFKTNEKGYFSTSIKYGELTFHIENTNIYKKVFIDKSKQINIELPVINTIIFNKEVLKIIDIKTNEEVKFKKNKDKYQLINGLVYGEYCILDSDNIKTKFIIDSNTIFKENKEYGKYIKIESKEEIKPVEPIIPEPEQKPDIKPVEPKPDIKPDQKPDVKPEPIIPDIETEPDIDEESILIPVPNTGLSIDTIVMYVKEKYII